MRTREILKVEFNKLLSSYHQITCGELRDICRRYGDKAVYLIDAEGNEVSGDFSRIHDFIYSYRWELHPQYQDPVKYLMKESFRQWGGYIDVPVYICETTNQRDYPSLPAFGEYTICGDHVIFRRNHEAYKKYETLLNEWRSLTMDEKKR